MIFHRYGVERPLYPGEPQRVYEPRAMRDRAHHEVLPPHPSSYTDPYMVSRSHPGPHLGMHRAPHGMPATQLRPIRNSIGWELWVLKLTAKERNQVISIYQLTDYEATNLKKTARRTKQRESQKRYVLRKRRGVGHTDSDESSNFAEIEKFGQAAPSRTSHDGESDDSTTCTTATPRQETSMPQHSNQEARPMPITA